MEVKMKTIELKSSQFVQSRFFGKAIFQKFETIRGKEYTVYYCNTEFFTYIILVD